MQVGRLTGQVQSSACAQQWHWEDSSYRSSQRSQDNVTSACHGGTESTKAKFRAAARAQARAELSRRWFAEENASFKHHKTCTFIECCCSLSSRLSSDTWNSKERRHVRPSKGDDVISASSLKKGIGAIRAEDVGHLSLWISMNCTWGSAIRRCNSDDKRLDSFVHNSVELWDEFRATFPNAVLLAHEVRAKGGTSSLNGLPAML